MESKLKLSMTKSAFITIIIIFMGCSLPTDSELKEYTITYDANGSDNGTVPLSQVKIEGDDLYLASNSGELAKTGYIFSNWNTSSDGSGFDYVEGDTY